MCAVNESTEVLKINGMTGVAFITSCSVNTKPHDLIKFANELQFTNVAPCAIA
jgi:hypothetical protein